MPFLSKVVRLSKDFIKVFNLPAFVWLATHIERNMAATHVVLDRDWIASSFKENQPVKSMDATTEKLALDRVGNVRNFCYFYEFR